MPVNKVFAAIAALAISLISLYVAGVRLIDPLLLRPSVFGLAVVVGILNWPLADEFKARGAKAAILWAIDAVLLIGSVYACVRYIQISETFEDGFMFLSSRDIGLGFLAMLTVMELTRRTLGWTIVIICGLAMVYMVFGEYLPGFLGNAGCWPTPLTLC